MKKTISTKTAERLQQTEEGRVLLGLIETYGTPAALAAKLKEDPQSVRHWLYVGSIPKAAAIRAAATLKKKPQYFRPDLPAGAWVIKEVEKPVREMVARSPDAKLLVSLADQYGGVKELCAAAECTTSEFHTWKTRGRIPVARRAAFEGLQA